MDDGTGIGSWKVEINEGHILNLNFDNYLMPTSKDMPTIIPIIVENPDPDGPYGAKSIGEPTLELGAAAIANAIAQATGKRIRSLPLNLERVLLGYPLKKAVTKMIDRIYKGRSFLGGSPRFLGNYGDVKAIAGDD